MKYKLDLGSFNKCAHYLPDGACPDWPLVNIEEVFYCMTSDGDIVSTKKLESEICIPTFNIGVGMDGSVDNPKVIETLLADIEVRICSMIRGMLRGCGLPMSLDNIVIPIRDIQFSNYPKDRLCKKMDICFGWAEVGIAYFKPSLVLPMGDSVS